MNILVIGNGFDLVYEKLSLLLKSLACKLKWCRGCKKSCIELSRGLNNE